MNKQLIIMFTIYFFIQSLIIFTVIPADENVYYYAAKLVSEGKAPYVDFFFAHPPLQLYIYAILIKLFGVHIPLLKAFTAIITALSGLLVYMIAAKRYSTKTGVVAALLFLSSYDGLMFGSYAFGIEIAVLFFLLSYYFLESKPVISGLFFALCIMTRLHLAPLLLVLIWVSKDKLKFITGFCAAAIYYLPLLFIPNFIDDVFLYHYMKDIWISGWLYYPKIALYLIVLFLLAAVFKLLKDKVIVAFILVYVGFIVMLGYVLEYYFLPVTALLCIDGAGIFKIKRYVLILSIMVVGMVAMIIFNTSIYFIDESKEYNLFVDDVSQIEGSIMGQPAISAMLALRTDKNITNDMVDMNPQRIARFNYSGLVVYNEGMFYAKNHNCSLIKTKAYGKTNYSLFAC